MIHVTAVLCDCCKHRYSKLEGGSLKFARITASKSRARTLIAESQNLITASRDLYAHAKKLNAESARLVIEGKRRHADFHLIRQKLGSQADHGTPGMLRSHGMDHWRAAGAGLGKHHIPVPTQ